MRSSPDQLFGIGGLTLLLTLLLGLGSSVQCWSSDAGDEAAKDKAVQTENRGVLPHFVLGRRFFKTTRTNCEIRGGEYVSPESDLLPEDWVDCKLPGAVRKLGSGYYHSEREVLASVYDYLYRESIERPRYALYTYVLIPLPSARSESILQALFATTSFVDKSYISYANLNIVYLPTLPGPLRELMPLISDGSPPPVSRFATQVYDYDLAQSLMAQICSSAPEQLGALCATDLSRGPYLFTFPAPASARSTMPLPLLSVDLSNVHERAFAEYIAAYKEQVKRGDYSDRERIDGFRLRLLSIILTSADWIGPIRGAVADTIHLAQ